ncbi:hypothetical protein M9H77_12823 [Catharanthus roseus]|uniref:Uncharacterized protein n=1 Tax=Catharanthus roseus TaxID=4058 RepID=A0ACC0BIN9_CATRO|nr:hypothetical protein M9H77_12823 [Catharanthus roseus]
MHFFVTLALHEHRRMNFGFIVIEHMLARQSSSTKCLPYGCFLTKIFQYFVINLVGVGDHIGPRKIYNQDTFTRMGFEKNNEGQLVRGGQDESDEEDDNDEERKEMNVGEEESDSETEQERFRRETRQKKRQERTEEGSSSGSMTQLMEMATLLEAKDLGTQGKMKEERSSY